MRKSKKKKAGTVASRVKKIGSWKVPLLFTEAPHCTQSCTDTDVPCCTPGLIRTFRFALSKPAYRKALVKEINKSREQIFEDLDHR